jgi:hypothetical protein
MVSMKKEVVVNPKARRVLFATGGVVPNGGQGYFPADIKRLYNFPNDLDGSGQTIGLLEFSNGYNLADAHQFWRMHGIQPPRITFVSVDGTPNDGGRSPEDEEATLDLQWAGALAPGAHIVVYEANAGNTYDDFAQAVTNTLQYILHDDVYHPSVLSISYGDGESSFSESHLKEWADLIAQLDKKGITVCISSGDQGSYGLHDPYRERTYHADAPASIPWAIAVGGTSLHPDGTETAWSYNGPENGGATGGGFSSVFPKPEYQSGISGSGRGLPDISCNADPATGYQIIFQGQQAVVGGTSVSSPVFAAVVALANQRRAQKGLPPLSGLAKILYSQDIQSAYRDITVGDNSFNGVPGYPAKPGWDACTGFGSFDATALIDYLSKVEPSRSSADSGQTQGAGDAALHSSPQRDGSLPAPPKDDRGIIVRVRGVIQQVEPDVESHGVHHHHLLVGQIEVLKVWNGTQQEVGDEVFVSIRFDDSLGLPGPIPDLKAGQPIELQGRYIPKNEAYPSVGNPGDPVIHETHHPFGYVVYDGQLYK